MSHVSFSELKIWKECPWKHKLLYIDKLSGFQGNEYTAFGTAIHSTYEQILLNNQINEKEHFQNIFLEELKALPDEVKNNLNKKLVEDLRKQGDVLAPLSMDALKDHFGEFEVVSVEEKLFEPIKEFVKNEYNFKGFIDLVIKTKDGKYHVIDWKTCSWGWDARKKTDKMITYQLTFYKYYFALKHNINPDDIETYFGLVKRTAKYNNIEIFKATSGKKKTENAVKFLQKALYNIDNRIHIKNKLSCHGRFGMCEFYKTKHCP
tara:strand:- start:4233 stop:5021 length:789 start_codon:yes stop_codon:yes gene_type:complete